MSILRTGIAASAITAGALLAPAVMAPASAASATQSTAASSPQLTAGSSAPSVIWGSIDLANKIWKAVQKYTEINQNREGLVRSLLEAAWYETGESHNVLVIKDDHPKDIQVEGVVSDATYSFDDYPTFRVIVFESGTVTNQGDGGFINWTFRGWWDRQDSTVTFHKP